VIPLTGYTDDPGPFIWDNRCSYHKAAGDYPPEEDRIHWRVSIKEASGTPRE